MENKINQNSNADYKECGDTCACRPSDEKCVDPRSRKPLPFMQRELADTAAGMTSPDYKKRFRAEYIQTKIRYEKLKDFCNTIEAAQRSKDPFEGRTSVEEPKHDCPLNLLREQQRAMGEYLHVLEIRAKIESIDLEMILKCTCGDAIPQSRKE